MKFLPGLWGRAVPLLALLFCTAANAGIVELRNGDRLHVQINAMDDGVLEVESELLGTLRLPWSEVVRLQTDKPLRMEFSDGRRIVGEFVIQEGSFPLEANSDVPFLDKAKLERIFDGPLLAQTESRGRVNLGGSFFRGNTLENKLNLDAEYITRTDDKRYLLAAVVNEGSTFGVKSTSDVTLSAQYDQFYNLKDYLYAKALAEQDDIQDLRLRSTLGVGYGRQLIESRVRNLAVEVGLSAIQENYAISPDQTYPSLGVVLKFDRRVFNSSVKLFSNLNASINLDNTQDSMLRNRMGFRVPIARNLNFSTQLVVDYDNLPVLGQKKTDSSLSFSVGYGF